LCLVAVFCLARLFGGRPVAMLSAAIVAINPLVFRGASIAFVDTLSALYVIVPLWLILAYWKKRDASCLAPAALCMGIGCGVKATNFVYAFVAVCFVLALLAAERGALGARVRRFALVAVVTALAALPWPARTWLLTGSPTFPPPPALGVRKPPLADRAPYTKECIEGFYSYVLSRYGDYHRSLGALIVFPWDVTMHPERFQIGDSIGTLLLCLLPLALVMAIVLRRRRALALLGYSFISSAAVYAFVAPEARYFIPAYMALAPPLALTAYGAGAWRAAAACARVVVLLNMFFFVAVAARIGKDQARAGLDRTYAQSLITANRPFAEAFRFLDSQRSARLVVLRYSQIFYYAHRRFIVDSLALRHPERYPGALLLDIDDSQTLERNLSVLRGDFGLAEPAPPILEKVFNGPDARVYRFTGGGQKRSSAD
jgi:4-amino-4-deoxy-L-arabinose transferase-like glycosyltransferase